MMMMMMMMMMTTRGERHWVEMEKMMTYKHDQPMNPDDEAET